MAGACAAVRVCGGQLERKDLGAAVTIPGPGIHQLAPSPQGVRSPIGLLSFVANDVRERVFGKLAREICFVAGPVAKRRSEAVRRVGRLKPPEEHLERHAAERPGGLEAGEHIVARSAHLHFPEDGDSAVRQGNAMLAGRLRPRGRKSPNLRVEVDLVPARGQSFARPRRRQDAVLERPRRDRLPFPKLGDEGGYLEVGHRRMMAATELRALRQELVEMAAPTGRVGLVLSNEAARPGSVQNRLDAPP
jgi:hypothetical protein